MNHKVSRSISLLSLSSAIIFAGCQKDEIGILNQDSAVISAKEWLETNKPDLEALEYTQTIDWNNAILLNNDGEQAVEVPLILENNASTNVVNDSEYKTHMRLLLIKDINNSYKAYNIVYTTKGTYFDNNDKSFNILDIGSAYSGFITIQNSNDKIVYSGKYENGTLLGLHNFDEGQNITNRLVCSYYVTVGPYTTCSNWVWYPDYGPGDLPYGYMPGISGPIVIHIPPVKLDPCNAAKTVTGISGNTSFINAKAAVIQAGADGNEHSITLGKGSTAAFTQAPMNNGGTNGVNVNQNLPGAFAAIHNHPNETPLSSGDIYVAVTLNTKNSNFTTSFITTAGETYAIVITDLTAAQSFVAAFPPVITTQYPPEFPDSIFNEIADIRFRLGESNESRTAAISLVLDNHNSGITLMKQDSSGNFNRVKIQEATLADGSKRYTLIPCN